MWKRKVATFTVMRKRSSTGHNQVKLFSPADFYRVNPYLFITQSRPLMTLRNKAFGKNCGKRRNCWQQAFSPFLTMFLTRS